MLLPTTCALYLFGETSRQVDDRHVGNWNAEGHSGQLAVERWNDLADGLGGTGRRWDDVRCCRATAAPVLRRWSVNRLLGGRIGVHGGHQGLNDLEVVVDDLGKGCQTVGRARCVTVVTFIHGNIFTRDHQQLTAVGEFVGPTYSVSGV
jgi:hypothetical protein